MCGFIVCPTGQSVNEEFVKHRGPDLRSKHSACGFDFYHYLLHITGALTPQPFCEDDIVCVYNGEIYNQAYTRSDGESIIPLYKKYGEQFTRYLDGEYAIALYDFHQEIAIFATDPFGTKPLYFNGCACASYRSCLGGTALKENSVLLTSLKSGATKTINSMSFDFDNQHKTNHDDWISAFEMAVRKRATTDCFIGLSSGYDSGALACALKKMNLPFEAYSVRGGEDLDILKARQALVGSKLFYMSHAEYNNCRRHLETFCEPYSYKDEVPFPLACENMFDCGGAIGGAYIFDYARKRGRRVYLSGQGADEILADYCLNNRGTHFGGIFPEKLYEWPNFHGGCQRAYLAKDEFVGGSFGIECRYPFLDPKVVQEFLWLAPALKNEYYKAPLHEYLTQNKFPFLYRVKEGFAADCNLINSPHDELAARVASNSDFSAASLIEHS